MTAEAFLRSARTVAVVGLSSDPLRPSHGVARYLQAHGYRVIPVNPRETMVLGQVAYPRLEDIPERVDIVDVFRRSEAVPEIAVAAITIGAKMLWLQEGVTHPAAEAQARAAGLIVVADRCILKVHRSLTAFP
ncbi:MAG: CoA-binding protein [Terriglobales bacterium]